MEEDLNEQKNNIDKKNINNKEEDKNAEVVSDIATSSTDSIYNADKTIIERLNRLYHSVEKPIEDAVHRVEDQLPDNFKGYSSLIANVISIASLSLLTLGLFALLKPQKSKA